jgi:hypothetical protein
MRRRLAHPARGVGYIVVVKPPFAAEFQDLALDLVVIATALAVERERLDERLRLMIEGMGESLGSLLDEDARSAAMN